MIYYNVHVSKIRYDRGALYPKRAVQVSNWKTSFNPKFQTGGDLGALAALGTTSLGKLVHEQLALQLTLSRDIVRDAVTDCSWFFFELMIKAMVEHLATANTLHAPRKHRWKIGPGYI